MLAWICENGMTNEFGKALEFSDRAFLVDPYLDDSPLQVIPKASQIGFSTLAILKVFHRAYYRTENVIYTLPSANDAQLFVKSKVNPMLEHNPALAAMLTGGRDAIEEKQVGGAHIFFRGTWTQRDSIMLTASLLVHDELDRSDLAQIDAYESRLAATEYKGRWLFSNPSVPGRGVWPVWLDSDQKHWFHRCSRCRYWQFLDWHESVCHERKAYICRKCREPLREEDRARGEWVAKYPGRDWSGYWINQMMAPWISARELLRQWNDPRKSRSTFYNFVLGMPYAGSGESVPRSLILANRVPPSPPEGPVYMGVDQGLRFHALIGDSKGKIVAMIEVDKWSDLDRLMRDWNIRGCVVDAQPERHGSAEFARRHPGKVLCCFYDTNPSTKRIDAVRYDEEAGVVRADRTQVIDQAVEAWREGRLTVAMDEKEPVLVGGDVKGTSFVEHWEALYVVKTRGNRPPEPGMPEDEIRIWERSGPDHWAHATVYYRLAAERWKNPDLPDPVVPRGTQPEEPPDMVLDDPWVTEEDDY